MRFSDWRHDCSSRLTGRHGWVMQSSCVKNAATDPLAEISPAYVDSIYHWKHYETSFFDIIFWHACLRRSLMSDISCNLPLARLSLRQYFWYKQTADDRKHSVTLNHYFMETIFCSIRVVVVPTYLVYWAIIKVSMAAFGKIRALKAIKGSKLFCFSLSIKWWDHKS